MLAALMNATHMYKPSMNIPSMLTLDTYAAMQQQRQQQLQGERLKHTHYDITLTYRNRCTTIIRTTIAKYGGIIITSTCASATSTICILPTQSAIFTHTSAIKLRQQTNTGSSCSNTKPLKQCTATVATKEQRWYVFILSFFLFCCCCCFVVCRSRC